MKMTTSNSRTSSQVAGSFRDPNGFMFWRDHELYRQVNSIYSENYDLLMTSDLYKYLIGKGWLVEHEEADIALAVNDDAYKILRPQRVPFVSYPYEWSFSQFQTAALLTLKIQRAALRHGMILKDASAYNIQFIDGKAVFIDTLSFERYDEGQPWVAYRQFCQHFLAPLALAHYKDIRLLSLSRLYIDGIPLDLAASLLPKRSWLKVGVAMHIHLHARAQTRYADTEPDETQAPRRPLSRRSLDNIINNLYDTVSGLSWHPDKTAWANYYEGDSYSQAGFDHKQEVVRQFITCANPGVLWDLGANTGAHSRIASGLNVLTVAWDIDPGAVELNYLQVKANHETNLLPLVLDLTNPSPAIGWANSERPGLAERSNADCILALALIHHLAIANNVPLQSIATFFASLAPWLIIEFVPKSDPKVKKLLATRQDIFPDYTLENFKSIFSTLYEIVEEEPLSQSDRTLLLFKRRT